MARPTKLTPEAHAQILKAITAAATRVDAAASAGVHYGTFLNWMKRGEQARKGMFFEFFNAITRAEADVRISLANAIAVAAKTDWRAGIDYLKRRDPANWGDKLQVSKLSDDELLRLLTLADRLGIESGSTAAGVDSSDDYSDNQPGA